MEATSQLAQTTLRSVLGQHELDDMLAEREKLNADIQRHPRRADRRLGHQGGQCRDQARRPRREHDPRDRAQAEAERIRRAKIIDAEGEFQAAQKLLDAAPILAHPAGGDAAALSLDAHDIAGERTSTIVFPFPTDLVQMFGGGDRKDRSTAA